MSHAKMNKRFWTWPIAIYLFLGGLGGGTLFMSGIFYFLGAPSCLGFGVFVGIVMLVLGCLLLIFELGQPKLFVRAFLAKTAIIKWGAVLLSVAMVFALVWWVFYWPAEWNMFWYGWGFLCNAAVAICMVASMGLMIYTGILLSSMKAKPFWNTPAVPILFTISAMSTGCALTALCLVGSPIDFWMFQTLDMTNFMIFIEYQVVLTYLHTIDIILVIAEMIVLILFTVMQYSSNEVTAKAVARRWLVGNTSVLFWGGMVIIGLAVPLLCYLFGGHGILSLYVAPILVLCGGLLLRFLFVYNNDRREIPGSLRYYEDLPGKDSAILHPYWEKTGKPF